MPPLAVLQPSPLWTKRATLFSTALLAIVLVGGYFYPVVLLLAPVVGYRLLYSYRCMQPGRVGIVLYDDRIVVKPPVGKRRELMRSSIFRFLAVYRGTTEVVVARCDDVDVRGAEGQPLLSPADVILPGGLMRNPGLVDHLERWRRGRFRTDSLIPAPGDEEKAR